MKIAPRLAFLTLLTASPLLQAASCNEALLHRFPARMSDWVRGAQTPNYYASSVVSLRKELDLAIAEIEEISEDQRNYANTVLAADRAIDDFQAEFLALTTISQLMPSDAEKAAELEGFSTGAAEGKTAFYANDRLFGAILSTPTDYGDQAELKLALIRRFQENGAHLSAEVRSKIAPLNAKIAQLQSQYDNARQNDGTTVELIGPELDGLDAKWLAELGSTEKLLLPVKDPGLVRYVLTHSPHEEVRKEVFLAYRSRLPENLGRMLQITQLNHEVSRLLGKRTQLDRAVDERSLAGRPEEAARLLGQLADGFKPAIKNRFEKMAFMKAADGLKTPFRMWDAYHYDQRLSEEEGLDVPDVSDYFIAGTFNDQMFAALRKMFKIEFVEMTDQPVWHPSVRLYRVNDLIARRPLGYLYVDNYSRLGKDPSTAFVEEVITRRRGEGREADRLPVAILATSWGDYEQRHEIRMPLDEVITAYHEMGHALHALMQEGGAFSVSGFSHPTDMMEVPSITLDRMVKTPEMLVELSALSGDPKDKMPWELAEHVVERMNGFRLLSGDFHSPSHEFNTIFLASFDQELQKAAPNLKTEEDILAVYRRMFEDWFGFAPAQEDHFPGLFHHLSGQYAGYYAAYTVAAVSAANNVDRVQADGGVLNPEALLRLRRNVYNRPQHLQPASEFLQEYWEHPVSAAPIFRELNFANRPSGD